MRQVKVQVRKEMRTFAAVFRNGLWAATYSVLFAHSVAGARKKFGVLIFIIIFVGRKTSVRLPYSIHNTLTLPYLNKNNTQKKNTYYRPFKS